MVAKCCHCHCSTRRDFVSTFLGFAEWVDILWEHQEMGPMRSEQCHSAHTWWSHTPTYTPPHLSTQLLSHHTRTPSLVNRHTPLRHLQVTKTIIHHHHTSLHTIFRHYFWSRHLIQQFTPTSHKNHTFLHMFYLLNISVVWTYVRVYSPTSR